MTRRSNLIRREGGTYYARIYVPADLKEQFPSEDKKVSLRTKDEAVAKRRLNSELGKWDALFEEIRSRRQVSLNDKAVAVWEHYEATLRNYEEKQRAMPTPEQIDGELQQLHRRMEMGEITSDDFAGMINAYTDYYLMLQARSDDANLRTRRLSFLKRALSSGEIKPVAAAATDFISRNRVILDERSAEYRELCGLLIRAEIEALQRTTERDSGDFTGVPKDPIVKPAKATVREVAAPGEGIMELFEVYAKENPRNITADTINQARRDVSIFVQHVGATYPATKIDKKAVREWKALLMLYPVKATETKAFAGMKIAQIVEHNKTVGKALLTPRTVNRYLSSLGAFCSWLVAHGYIDSNPTDGMSLAKDKRKKVFPFTVEQMNALFKSPLFTGCKSDEAPRFWNKPGTVLIRDHRYWVPLIMLYSGARPAEIAQLAVQDIRQDQEAWIMDITETSDDGEEDLKSLKTLGSRRIVPIHPELQRLGFLAYLEETRKAGHSRVFPFATRNARGQMIADFSREFGRYLTKIGLKKGRGISLYSFRHGAVDALRRAGYLDDQFNFIFGHGNGNLVTRGYGVLVHGMLAQRVELVHAIEYKGLELGHLTYSEPH